MGALSQRQDAVAQVTSVHHGTLGCAVLKRVEEMSELIVFHAGWQTPRAG